MRRLGRAIWWLVRTGVSGPEPHDTPWRQDLAHDLKRLAAFVGTLALLAVTLLSAALVYELIRAAFR